MIDIESQNRAIKIGWIKRLLMTEGVWSSFIREKLPRVELAYLMRCNIQYKDLRIKIPIISIWADILKEWCHLNFNADIENKEAVLNQNLWYNSHIKIGGVAGINWKWYNAGIKWLSDIVNEETGRMLRLAEIERKYGLAIPFTEYLGVKISIPRHWWVTISRVGHEEEEEDYKWIDRIMDNQQHGKMIYNHLVQTEFIAPTKKAEKWNEDLQTHLTNQEMHASLEKPRITTINNKLRSFNYNFYMRNVPYGTKLKKMGTKDHDKCHECGEQESLLHLYWTCPMSYRLWERLKDTLMSKLGLKLSLKAELCLLGINNSHTRKPSAIPSDSKQLIRTLSLLTRHYIHLCKCAEEGKSFRKLLKYIKDIYNIEKRIASKKGSLHLLNRKWGIAADWLNAPAKIVNNN